MRSRFQLASATGMALILALGSPSARAAVILKNSFVYGQASTTADGGAPQAAAAEDQQPGAQWNNFLTALSSNPDGSNSASAFVDCGYDATKGIDAGNSAVLSVLGSALARAYFGDMCTVVVTNSPVAYQASYSTSGSAVVRGGMDLRAHDAGLTHVIHFESPTNTMQAFSGTLAPGSYTYAADFTTDVTSAPGGSIGTGAYIHFTGYSSQARVTSQPPGIIVDPFQPVPTLTLPTSGTGDGTVSEQWLYNGSPLSNGGNVSGANSATLTITNFSAANNGAYSCVYSNAFASDTSDIAVCELGAVSSLPLLTYQPQDEVLNVRGNFFAVRAFSSGPLTYEWTRGGVPIADGVLASGAVITGSHASGLLISEGTPAETGDYQCIVTDDFGSVASNVAHLTLNTTAVGPSAAGTLRFLVGPNPARSAASLAFTLPAAGTARLEVIDVAGRRVATLVNGALEAGPHVVVWDLRTVRGESVSPGLYLARLVSGNASEVRRVVVVR